MFIFWHFETSASIEVTSPPHLWTPFSWDAIHMDLYRTGYFKSIVLLENTEVQVSWEALGVHKLISKKWRHCRSSSTTLGATRQEGSVQVSALSKCPMAINDPCLCLSFPICTTGHFTSCAIGVQTVYLCLFGSAQLQTEGAAEKWSMNNQTSNQQKLIQQILGFKSTL